MTGYEWAAETDPMRMWRCLLRSRPTADRFWFPASPDRSPGPLEPRDRKLRLAAVSLCRCVAHLLPGVFWRAPVAELERWADGAATAAAVERRREELGLARWIRVGDVERTARALRPRPAPGFLHAVYHAMEAVRGFDVRSRSLDYSLPLSHALWAATFEAGAPVPRVNVGAWPASDRPPLFFSRFGRVPARARNAGTERMAAGLCWRIRDVFGNPCRPVAFDPAWRTRDALLLARQMSAAQEFSAMPILADALQDAGCDSEAILDHCRDTTAVHVRGCWVVDLVLGRE